MIPGINENVLLIELFPPQNGPSHDNCDGISLINYLFVCFRIWNRKPWKLHCFLFHPVSCILVNHIHKPPELKTTYYSYENTCIKLIACASRIITQSHNCGFTSLLSINITGTNDGSSNFNPMCSAFVPHRHKHSHAHFVQSEWTKMNSALRMEGKFALSSIL